MGSFRDGHPRDGAEPAADSADAGRGLDGSTDPVEDRAKAEEALRASEAFYHALVEGLPQNILRKDLDGRFTFGNGRACATLGRPPEAILGRTDFDFYPAALAEKYRRDDDEVVRTGKPLEMVEENVLPDGSKHYMQVIKSPLYGPDGYPVGVQVIYWDVTEGRRAQDELAASEARFALAARGSNDGIWDWDLVTGALYLSPRFRELIGAAGDAFTDVRHGFEASLHPEDRDRVLKALADHLERRTPYDEEYRLRTGWGDYRWFHVRGQALWDESGRATRIAGSLSDITRRKHAEDQLLEQNQRLRELAASERRVLEALKQAQVRMVQSEKMAGLGQLVAGVAHEINNPLAFVTNNVAVLERDLAEVRELLDLYGEADGLIAGADPSLRDRIDALRERADVDYTLENLPGLLDRSREGLSRIRRIVQDLRAFARLDEGEVGEADLVAGIESTATIIAGHAKTRGVAMELDLRPLPPLACHAAKINQVIMNLASNAIDACRSGGRVTIRTDQDEDSVRIEVADTGSGIDPAIRDRIFDPFFTTKPVGEGTGLGLSISYGIVRDHGGSIDVESEPGRGTRFVVRLPRRPSPAPRSPDRPVAVAAPPAAV